MADPVALQGFVDKWLRREPEMAIAESFCRQPERPLWSVWGALSSELIESAFELTDANVARTKLAWWGSDLAAGTRGRHPLTRALFANPAASRTSAADWTALATAAIHMTDSDHRPANLQAALAELLPVATAFAHIEGQLWQSQVQAAAVALNLQVQRNVLGWLGVQPERSRLPIAWRAADGRDDLSGYATAVRVELTQSTPGGFPTTFRLLASDWRLRRLIQSGDIGKAAGVPPLRALLLAWRAARSAAASRH